METTTAPAARRIQKGDAVRIIRGAHGGRVGKVTHTGITALYVEFEAPVLFADPDGPTRTVTLPFSRRELVLVEEPKRVRRTGGSIFVITTPMPDDFRPRHCSGADTHPSGCLPLHPGDEACGCGQAVLPPDGGAVVLQVRPHDSKGATPGPFIRHNRELCHQVSPSAAPSAVSA